MSNNKTSLIELSNLVEEVIRDENRGNIKFELAENSSEIFANVNEEIFRTMLSTILNESSIDIFVSLSLESSGSELEIRFNEKVILADITNIENEVVSWGGRFIVESLTDKESFFIVFIPHGLPPKGFVSKLDVEGETDRCFVLIDDDELVRMTWKFSAESSNINLSLFESEVEFFKLKNSFSKERTTIYIDSSLDGDVAGEDVAKILFDEGFKTIYIATGFKKDRFKEYTFLAGVIGKIPPW